MARFHFVQMHLLCACLRTLPETATSEGFCSQQELFTVLFKKFSSEPCARKILVSFWWRRWTTFHNHFPHPMATNESMIWDLSQESSEPRKHATQQVIFLWHQLRIESNHQRTRILPGHQNCLCPWLKQMSKVCVCVSVCLCLCLCLCAWLDNNCRAMWLQTTSCGSSPSVLESGWTTSLGFEHLDRRQEVIPFVSDCSGVIFLESRLDCKRGLILDGSGKDVTISGHGLKLNVDTIVYRSGNGVDSAWRSLDIPREFVLGRLTTIERKFPHRMRFANGEGLDDNDALLLKGNYRNAWIHKCTFTTFTDALINIEKVDHFFFGISS